MQAILYDEKGNPVFPANYRIGGFGRMPGAGKWKAFLECYGGPPVLLGEYLLNEGPKAPPPPPPVVPTEKFGLDLKIARKDLPSSYSGPFPAFGADEVYPGMDLILDIAQPAGWSVYRHGRPESYDFYLDGEKVLRNAVYDWNTSIFLPGTLSVGVHRLTLRAAHLSEGRKIEFEGSTDIRVVGRPQDPRLSVSGKVESGAEASAVIMLVHPTMEVQRVEVGNSVIPWSTLKEKDSIALKFLVPIERVWENGLGRSRVGTEKDTELRITYRQRLSDTKWHQFLVNHPVKVKIICSREVRPSIEASPGTVVLRPYSEVYLKIAGFPCGDRVSILSQGESGERIDWGAGGILGPAGDGLEGGGSGSPIYLSRIEERLKPRRKERHEFIVKGESGQEARAAITIVPATYIEVEPRRAKPGERIRIKPFGFKTGMYVHAYLGEARLTPEHGKPIDREDPIEVRLPEGIAGRQAVRLVDNDGNRGEDSIEIEGEGEAAICTKPCVKLPPRARQGERFDAVIGGFGKNEQLVVRFADLFEVAKPYQGELMVKQPVLVPRDLPDGRYRVTVSSPNDPALAAAGELDVAGGYRPPTLAITCPRGQEGCDVPRFKPGESLNTTGLGWMVKGRFGGTLTPERGPGRPIAVLRDGCVWGFVEGSPQGKPCDEENGEISKFWELPKDLPGGSCVIEVSDGASSARAKFTVDSSSVPGEEKPLVIRPKAEAAGSPGPGLATPGDRLEIRGSGFPPGARLRASFDGKAVPFDGPVVADSAGAIGKLFLQIPPDAKPGRHALGIATEVQRVYGAGSAGQPREITVEPVEIALTVVDVRKGNIPDKPAADRPPPTQTPAVPPATAGQPCNPDLPKIWQPGCVDGSAQPPPAQPQRPVAAPPPPPQTPAAPPLCDPNRPRYTQPGCVEPAAKPNDSGARPPGKCNPNIPMYMQPGCIP